jgi:hypothetical protein
MSGRLIGYPTGWTLAVFDDEASAEAARADLEAAASGPGEEVIVLAGPDATERMTRLGTASGLGARMRRAMQFMTMDQLPDLRVYELALEGGRPVLGLRVDDAARRRSAIEAILRRGGHFVNRFGAWATEEIAPWRGEMPSLPQYMRR